MFLRRGLMRAGGQGVAQVLGDMLAQQQTAGNIAPLENAAKRVALFLDLPNTVGTGTNIQAFLARVDELRTIALQVKRWGSVNLPTHVVVIILLPQNHMMHVCSSETRGRLWGSGTDSVPQTVPSAC